jgi:hypothetical protein
MASHALAADRTTLGVLLATVSSPPRALFSRMIDRMGEMDGNTDIKPDQNYYAARNDGASGVSAH